MTLISWSDKFSIGVGMIDEQHKNLFRLVNDMHDYINSGSAKDKISSALDALINYTEYHFKEEEDYMFNVEYTRFEQHKIAHDNLTVWYLIFSMIFQRAKVTPKSLSSFYTNGLQNILWIRIKRSGNLWKWRYCDLYYKMTFRLFIMMKYTVWLLY